MLIVFIFEAIIWSVLFKKTKKKDKKNTVTIKKLLVFLDLVKILLFIIAIIKFYSV